MQAGADGSGTPPPPGQEMAPDTTDPLQPQSPNEVPRPQSPLGSAVDASVGRAANNGGYFPG